MTAISQPSKWTRVQALLAAGLLAACGAHALLLVAATRPQPASRLLTAFTTLLAAGCGFWRSTRVAPRERVPWVWQSIGLVLWSCGQIVELAVGSSTAASNLRADPSDLLYVFSAFPLLLALSSTTETESLGSLFVLNLSQAALAFGLIYTLLFRTPGLTVSATTIMQTIYAVECGLLAVAATFRLVTWSTWEERRRVRLLCGAMWLYLPIELGMDYATARWRLPAGTPLDLLWSLPFVFAGWRALGLPLDGVRSIPPRIKPRSRIAMMLESLCPMLITAAVFCLAALLVPEHRFLALAAVMLLLIIQGLHSGLIQLDYIQNRHLLLEREQQLKEANAGLQKLSLLDPLTGISNRRHFTTAIETEWRRATRRQQPIAVLMIDVDLFKAVNDLYGHAYGDECLVRIAQVMNDELRRANDLLARFGGEEFILLLPETDHPSAVAVAERMRSAVNGAGMLHRGSEFNQQVTVSIGVSSIIPFPGLTADALIASADKALYEAKRLGRNRVCSRTEASPPVASPASRSDTPRKSPDSSHDRLEIDYLLHRPAAPRAEARQPGAV